VEAGSKADGGEGHPAEGDVPVRRPHRRAVRQHRHEDPETGLVTSLLTSVRAVLTSSSVRPCLDMEGGAREERRGTRVPDAAPPCLRRVRPGLRHRHRRCRHHRPGGCARRQGLWEALPGGADVPVPRHEPRRCADEVRNGARIFRGLYTVKFEDLPNAGSGAQTAAAVRNFASSMPSGMLSPTEKLKLVRFHWVMRTAITGPSTSRCRRTPYSPARGRGARWRSSPGCALARTALPQAEGEGRLEARDGVAPGRLPALVRHPSSPPFIVQRGGSPPLHSCAQNQ